MLSWYLRLYTFFFICVLPIIWIILFFLYLTKIFSLNSFLGKVGFLPKTLFQAPKLFSIPEDKEVIWMHVSSIGEYQSAKLFIATVKQQHNKCIAISFFNHDTEKQVAKDNLADIAFFLPMENPYSYCVILQKIKASKIFIFETETWPLLLATALKHDIPVYLFNATIKKIDVRTYRLLKPMLSPFYTAYHHVFAQTQADKNRFLAIGFPANKISIGGSFKYHMSGQLANTKNLSTRILPNPIAHNTAKKIRQKYGIPLNAFLLTFGSVHPREDVLLVKALMPLLQAEKNMHCIIAPRNLHHISRLLVFLKNVFRITTERLPYQLYSAKKTSSLATSETHKILILDTYGDLPEAYAISDLVIIGGSFLPLGGHNFLEAIQYNKKVVLGPHMDNFATPCADFASYLLHANKQTITSIVKHEFLSKQHKPKHTQDNGLQLLLSKQSELKALLEILVKNKVL